MSIKVMTAVWACSQASEGSLLVLLAIADNAREDGMAWPGIESLASRARLSERQVTRIIRETLIPLGELEITREGGGRGRSTQYRICLETLTKEHPLSEPQTLTPATQTLTPTSENPDADVRGTVRNRQRTVKPRAKETGADWKRYKRSDESNDDRPPGASVERWLVKEMSDHFGVKVVQRQLERCELFFVWRKVKQYVDDGHKGTLKELMPRAQAEYQAEIDQITPEPDATPHEEQTLAIYQDIEAKRQADYAAEYAAWEQETYAAVNGAQ